MKKIENIIGIILSFIVIFFGRKFLISGILFFRLLAGITLGYALTRSFMGFAGSVNRAYNSGSTKLMRVLAVMFTITALISIAFLYNVDASTYDLWVNPINLGLILGGILFGFGMTFSVCCASGVLTDLVTGLPRAIITLLFFCMGVFLGFPIQSKASWVTDSWFTTEIGSKLSGGVYLPDLFKNDGLNGYIGASIVTIIFAGITIWISYKYEDSRKLKNSFYNIESESIQYKKEELEYKPFKLISERTYNKIFVKPWTMETGAIVITGVFTLLMGVTKAGWGASTPYGFWFGTLLLKLGVPIETITSFSTKPASVFTMSFFSHPINVQNFGIVLGTIICLLLAGTFTETSKSELKISKKDAFLFALGGISMGFGTRLANGCNVGALYTPIANFSLSGWIFFIFLVIGGILGNKISRIIK